MDAARRDNKKIIKNIIYIYIYFNIFTIKIFLNKHIITVLIHKTKKEEGKKHKMKHKKKINK